MLHSLSTKQISFVCSFEDKRSSSTLSPILEVGGRLCHPAGRGIAALSIQTFLGSGTFHHVEGLYRAESLQNSSGPASTTETLTGEGGADEFCSSIWSVGEAARGTL